MRSGSESLLLKEEGKGPSVGSIWAGTPVPHSSPVVIKLTLFKAAYLDNLLCVCGGVGTNKRTGIEGARFIFQGEDLKKAGGL